MGAANGIFAGYGGLPGTEQAPGWVLQEANAVRPRAEGTTQQVAGQRLAGPTAVQVPQHMRIVLDGPARAPHGCRVEDPSRLLRVWALLSAASRELHQAGIPQAAVAALLQQLQANVSELQRSLSPDLAGELGRLMSDDDAGPPDPDQLRVAYATLLGWLRGVVIAMLDQLEQSSTAAAEAFASQKGGG